MPASSSLPMETSATAPKITMATLGGMIGPIIAEATVTAALKSAG